MSEAILQHLRGAPHGQGNEPIGQSVSGLDTGQGGSGSFRAPIGSPELIGTC